MLHILPWFKKCWFLKLTWVALSAAACKWKRQASTGRSCSSSSFHPSSKTTFHNYTRLRSVSSRSSLLSLPSPLYSFLSYLFKMRRKIGIRSVLASLFIMAYVAPNSWDSWLYLLFNWLVNKQNVKNSISFNQKMTTQQWAVPNFTVSWRWGFELLYDIMELAWRPIDTPKRRDTLPVFEHFLTWFKYFNRITLRFNRVANIFKHRHIFTRRSKSQCQPIKWQLHHVDQALIPTRTDSNKTTSSATSNLKCISYKMALDAWSQFCIQYSHFISNKDNPIRTDISN